METLAEIRVRLLLSVQRALLGAVPATLRQVACGWKGTEIKLRFVFDGEIDPDDYDGAQIASTEVIADFSKPWTISKEIIRIDYPTDLRERWPAGNMVLAYLRKEPLINNDSESALGDQTTRRARPNVEFES